MENLIPATYQGEQHPLFSFFDKSCTACSLSSEPSVGVTCPDNISNVRLMVISDYPGFYEQKVEYNFYSNDPDRFKRGLEGFRNAGSLIRWCINKIYNLDPVGQVIYTNVVKCNPMATKTESIKDSLIKGCARLYLAKEIDIIQTQLPGLPMLILGNTALKAMRLVWPSLFKDLKMEDARRELFYLNDSPLTFSFNPAAVARSISRIDKNTACYRNGTQRITEIEDFHVVGSPLWIYAKDLKVLKPFIKQEG